MKLHLNNPDQSLQILSWTKDDRGYQITIGETTYKESVILTPEKLELWSVSQVSELKSEHFMNFASMDIEVLILGTGDTTIFPDPVITKPVMGKGIGVEVMNTTAACRTYNILCADGRRVAAGLIL